MTQRRLKTSLATAQRIWKRDQWTCRQCGSQDDLVVDHVTPLSASGNNDDNNLQTLCSTCNLTKAKQERPAQERRSIIALRMTDAGRAVIDALALEWTDREGGRSEVIRCLLAEAVNDPRIVERARKRYMGAHNRVRKGNGDRL